MFRVIALCTSHMHRGVSFCRCVYMCVCVCMNACVWVRRSVFLSNLCSGQDACQTSLGVLENGYPVLFRLSSGKVVRVRLHIRVRMLVRTSTYARSCICAMAPKAHGLLLVIGFSSWRIC